MVVPGVVSGSSAYIGIMQSISISSTAIIAIIFLIFFFLSVLYEVVSLEHFFYAVMQG